MSVRRLVSRFFIKLTVGYALFLMLWWGVSGWYAGQFQAFGTQAFKAAIQAVGSEWIVLFEPAEHPTVMMDTDLVLLNRHVRGAVGRRPTSSRYQSYAPSAMVLTLVLASPISWRRKLLAATGGLVMVELWTAFCFALMVLDSYTNDPVMALYDVGPFVKRSISYATFTLTSSPVTRYAVPTLFWILATFRREDFVRFGELIAEREGPVGE